MVDGQVKWIAGATPPKHFSCDGQEVSQATYPLLYAIVGDNFGSASAGNFRLPDLRGRSPRHGETLGDAGGADSVTLTESQLPAHSHNLGAKNGFPDNGAPSPSVVLSVADIYSTDSPDVTLGGAGEAGGGEPVSVTNPWLGLNAVIEHD